MRKIFTRALIVLALVTSGIVGVAIPAQASAPASCNNWSSWVGSGGTGWGQARWCTTVDANGIWYPEFQVDDTLTDGYAVHLEFQDTFNALFHASGNGTACATTESAGPVDTSCWGANTWGYYGGITLWMRLVKGRASGTGGHQDVGHWTSGWVTIIVA